MKTVKKKIGIFFGGCSPEYEVSLQSAFSVIKYMDRERFVPVLIGIERKRGNWYWYHGEEEKIVKDQWLSKTECIPVFPCMDRLRHGICYMENGSFRGLSLDAAFPVLHGKNGEDGTLQGLLELSGIPVIGCGVLSSALCMDKKMAHRIAAEAGVRTARSVLVGRSASEKEIREAAAKLQYPIFIKPNRGGSSIGITVAEEEESLMRAVKEAFLYDTAVLLEERISGVEVGCAVLGCEKLAVGEVDEIELSDRFFDYAEKYTLKSSRIYAPARIPEEKALEIKEAAKKIYRLLRCSFFARVDFFLTGEGEIYFNEVNTIPGFTPHSRFPGMFQAAGISFEELVNHLLEMGGQE